MADLQQTGVKSFVNSVCCYGWHYDQIIEMQAFCIEGASSYNKSYQDNYPLGNHPPENYPPPPPENYPRRTITPRKITPRKITPQGQLPPRTITPRKITPRRITPRGQLPPEDNYPPRTTTPKDNYPPRTTTPEDNYPPPPPPPWTLLGMVAQWLERPPHEREVVGSNPGRVIPKTYNNGTFCLLAIGAQHIRLEKGSKNIVSQGLLEEQFHN